MSKEWQRRIGVCDGQACITDADIPVRFVRESIEAGLGDEEILKNFPAPTREDLDAVRGYPRYLKEESIIPQFPED